MMTEKRKRKDAAVKVPTAKAEVKGWKAQDGKKSEKKP